MPRIVEIVVDGGPCAGKSSILARALELENEECDVIIIPETATELFSAGIAIGESENFASEKFQELVLKTQLEKEEGYREKAAAVRDKKTIIILKDRGAMSGRAYMSPGNFEVLVKKFGLSVSQLRDKNDGVIHLVTAAIGAEEFYTTSNNSARKESRELAARLDLLTRDAWVGCPHMRVIESFVDIEEKKAKFFRAIRHFAGIPRHIELERRFLLGYLGYSDIKVLEDPTACRVVRVSLEQIYLHSEDGNGRRRIRKRTSGGFNLHYLTRKEDFEDGAKIEDEVLITPGEYEKLLQNEKDDARDIIRKNRYYFLWKNKYFELDIFEKPERLRGLAILEIELIDKNEPIEFPPFLCVLKEVTGIKKYSNASFAKKYNA